MTFQLPYLAIVTVVLNDKDGLTRTSQSLHSVLDGIEWIIVDGGSTDGSARLAEGLSECPRVQTISGPDRGIYDAMNKGVQLVSAKYVLFLNAGDTIIPGCLNEVKTVVETCDRESGAVFLFGVMLRMPSGQMQYRAPRRPQYIWHSLPTSHQAMVFPTGFIRDCPYDLTYTICGDYAAGAQAYKKGLEFVRIDLPISIFSTGGYSYQHPLRLIREAMQIQRVTLRHGLVQVSISAVIRTASLTRVRLNVMRSKLRRSIQE